MDKENQKRFDSLRKLLEEQTEWPTVYLFKFIVPNDIQHFAQVKALFGPEAEITTKESSKGTYTSFSIKEVMMSADDIMIVYKRASEIPGLIAL